MSVFGQAESPIGERSIEPINLLNAIGIEWLVRLFIRPRTSQRDVTGRPIFGNLSRIDLIREITVDYEFGPGGRGDTGFIWIYSGDSGYNPIGFRKIKPRIHAQAHDRGCGMRFTLTGHDSQDLKLG